MGSKANFDAVQKRKKQRTKNNLKKLLLLPFVGIYICSGMLGFQNWRASGHAMNR